MTDAYNAADPAQVKSARISSRQYELSRAETTRSIMSSVGGRKWLYDLLVDCHAFTSPFSTNSLSFAFAAGEQNVGLRLFAEVSTDFDLFVLMLKEAKERQDVDKRDDRPRDPTATDTLDERSGDD